MIYHIVVGDEAARPLKEAIAAEPSMDGEVVVLKDILPIGPLQREEGQSFSALRSAWWQTVAPEAKPPIEVTDLERLLEVSNELYKSNSAVVWFWMAPSPADVCAYHWILPYMGKHVGRFYLLNLANLPFLNEAGKVFYPKNISELMPRELVKARKLARPVTSAELEMDGDAWQKLVEENGGVRTTEGGKKLKSQPENYYDAQLISTLSAQSQKASRVLNQAMSKFNLPTGDLHLAWRLRTMAEAGMIELTGDTSRPYKEWEVRLPVTATEETAPQ
jgi:hypothetical protein